MFGINEHKRNIQNQILNSFQKAVEDTDFKSAVAIILKNGKVLMGISTAKDERLGKYCFPGGKIDKGENIYRAAVREAKEESGVTCMIQETTVPIEDKSLKGVGFIECEYVSGNPNPNWEFEDMKWFDLKNLPENTLELNKKIIKKIISNDILSGSNK